MNIKSEFKLIFLYMNDLFLEMFSFTKKILLVCINYLRNNKALLSIVILIEYIWYGIYALCTSWAIMWEIERKVQKDETATSERKNVPQEQTLFMQKDDFIQKGHLQKHASHKVLYFQSFLYTLHRQIWKSQKGDLTWCRKGADKCK